MVGSRAYILVAGLAGCSVPDLDLSTKGCPCSSGYVCVANTCQRSTGDGGATSCLGSAPGASLYADNFDAPTIDPGWTTTAMWSQGGGQLTQNDPSDQLAFASTSNVTTTSYRVVAQMTAPSGGLAMGIAVRMNPGGKQQYDCLWEPGITAVLLWQSTNAGGQPSTLMTQVGLPSSTSVTMEVTAIGTDLRCCIDNIAGATLDVSDPSPSYTTGEPGLVTDHMRASFDNFAVYAN
jgi:hypothetical protein